MYSITLVCTRHEELGKCHSNELHQIIETINLDVIFEEIPPSFFDKYYIPGNHHHLFPLRFENHMCLASFA
jgi:hypothetical protein